MNEVIKMTDIDKLLELAKENTLSTKVLTQAFVSLKQNDAKQDLEIESIKKEVTNIKFNEEITDQQAGIITSEAKRLAYETTKNRKHLFRYAIHDIYKHLTERWNMGNKVRTTKKGNYDSVIEGLRTYKPDVNALQERYEKNKSGGSQ